MKFENGQEQKSIKDRIKKGEPDDLDAYKLFNGEAIPELLDKRKTELRELIRRQRERRNKLEQDEAAGKLFTKI